MRKKLMFLSVLTCVVGGPTLAIPAESQGGYPGCTATTGTPCSGDGYRSCQDPCVPEGSECFLGVQACIDGTWEIPG